MFCVEFSHIYGNEVFGEMQQKSFEIYSGIKKEYPISRVCCLIDNYNADFLNKNNVDLITSRDKSVNVFFEKDLLNFAHIFFKKSFLRLEKFGNKNVFFLNEIAIFEEDLLGNVKYYCASLCTVWYLIRLGRIENDFFLENANGLINILEKKYKKNEDKVIDILINTGYNDVINNIKYIWIED